MSYQEAIADGVPVGKDLRGFIKYKPPCAICGTPIYSWNYRRDVQYMCVRCRSIHKRIQERNHVKESMGVPKNAHEIT